MMKILAIIAIVFIILMIIKIYIEIKELNLMDEELDRKLDEIIERIDKY